jgi:PAS domain-containing protein
MTIPDAIIENQSCMTCAELNERIAKLEQQIQEMKISGEALKDSEKRYRQLFESAKDGILILDA